MAWAAAPQLRLLVVQPSPFCNIDCSYCYLADRKNSAKMDLATLVLACRRVFESEFLAPQLKIAWHGGEPLVVPRSWYQAAVTLIGELSPPGLQLRHSFQTNGLLLDADWARFLAGLQASVGLSIDGPADLHDARRRTRQGKGTHAGAMRAARLLRDQGLPFHVITVLTEQTLDEPERLFAFYVENGIREVGFNIEEIEGAHRTSSLAGARIEARYRGFVRRFFALVCDAPGLLRVREFESTIGLLLAPEPARDEQNLPFVILSVAYDGALSTFSPELLGARHERFADFAIGHVATESLAAAARGSRFNAINDEIRRGVEACAGSCRYFRWCGGGAPANKLFETGRFDTTQTMHCRLTRQIMLDEVLAGIESRAGRLHQTRNHLPADAFS
jgi:uncharacterized protein